jgi:hypothetical protein
MVYHESYQLARRKNTREQTFWQVDANVVSNFGDDNLEFGAYELCQLPTCDLSQRPPFLQFGDTLKGSRV